MTCYDSKLRVIRIQWDLKNNSDYAKIRFTRRKMYWFWSFWSKNLVRITRRLLYKLVLTLLASSGGGVLVRTSYQYESAQSVLAVIYCVLYLIWLLHLCGTVAIQILISSSRLSIWFYFCRFLLSMEIKFSAQRNNIAFLREKIYTVILIVKHVVSYSHCDFWQCSIILCYESLVNFLSST